MFTRRILQDPDIDSMTLTCVGVLSAVQCHKAKNFVPEKEKESTKTSIAVREVQRLLPRAHVVYCSATGVTTVANMAFMDRLVSAQAQTRVEQTLMT